MKVHGVYISQLIYMTDYEVYTQNRVWADSNIPSTHLFAKIPHNSLVRQSIITVMESLDSPSLYFDVLQKARDFEIKR